MIYISIRHVSSRWTLSKHHERLVPNNTFLYHLPQTPLVYLECLPVSAITTAVWERAGGVCWPEKPVSCARRGNNTRWDPTSWRCRWTLYSARKSNAVLTITVVTDSSSLTDTSSSPTEVIQRPYHDNMATIGHRHRLLRKSTRRRKMVRIRLRIEIV